MLAVVQKRPAILCDVCGYAVRLNKGEIIASVAQIPGHLPKALITCNEGCATIAELRLEVKPLQRLPMREVLEALLRE